VVESETVEDTPDFSIILVCVQENNSCLFGEANETGKYVFVDRILSYSTLKQIVSPIGIAL
jgi:hypothetical protein